MNDTRKKTLEILEKSFVVDMHMDIGLELEKQRKKGYSHVLNNDYLEEFTEGKVDLVVAAIFIENDDLQEKALRTGLRQVSAILKDIEECKDNFILCKDLNDIKKIKEENKIGIMLSFEGLEPVEDDLELLNIFYELGVRLIGLVWSRRNKAGDGCTFEPVERGTEGGLTEFGLKVLRFAKEKKMVIDISHLNDVGTSDVLELNDNPVIASHSNAREIHNIKRNLTDEQLKTIALNGGVVGINAAKVITGNKENANMEDLFKHLDYIKNLIGSEHIGFGFDLCDKLIKHSIKDLSTENITSFDVLNTHRDILKLVDMMVENGYKDKEIENILGKNFLRVLQHIMK